MNHIRIANLGFAYEKQPVLEDVNLEYDKKDFLALIGPNGGGKSTLLKLILGLLKPDRGSVRVAKGTSLAYVPQNTNINRDFPIRVIDTVLMGRLSQKRFGFFRKEDFAKARKALNAVGLEDFENRSLAKLSGGQRQRVFIARALCSDADILLLDEPTASLDSESQIQIYELLKKLNKSVGVIIVSHDTTVLLGYATKIAHINQKLHLHGPLGKKREDFHGEHVCPVELIHAGCDHV